MKSTNIEIQVLKRLLREFRLPERGFEADTALSNVTTMSASVIANALDRALFAKRFNGKPMPSFLRNASETLIKVKQPTDAMFDRYYSLDENELYDIVAAFVHSDENTTFYKKNKNMDAEMASIFYSFLLFTSASVETIRVPSHFHTWDVNKISHHESPHREITPTREDYRNAKKILEFAAQTKNRKGPQNLYRGITLKTEISKNLKAGIEFNNYSISSWTTDMHVAHDFAYSGKGDAPVMLKIPKCQWGSDVTNASNYGEFEVIMGKKLRILAVNLRRDDDASKTYDEQEKIWKKQSLRYAEAEYNDLASNDSKLAAVMLCEVI